MLSDWARVRKPFMLVGAVCTMVMMVFLILQTDDPHTGYYSNVLVIVLLAVTIGFTYAPWMANYTEQVESHNPALTASGLAVWGWILRIMVALSFLVLPQVITTSTTLVDNQQAGATLAGDPGRRALRAPAPPACVQRPRRPPSVITGLQATGEPGPRRWPAHRRLRLDPQPRPGAHRGRRLVQSPGARPPRLQPAGHGHPEGAAGE